MLDVVVRHIGMPQAVHGDFVGQADGLADLVVGLFGAAVAAAPIGEGGRAADILVFPLDGGILFPDFLLCDFLLCAGELQFRLPQRLFFALLDQGGLFLELFAEHFQIVHSLPVQDDDALPRFGFGGLRHLAGFGVDHVLVDDDRLAVLVVVRPGEGQGLSQPQAGVEDEQQFVTGGVYHQRLPGVFGVLLGDIGASALRLIGRDLRVLQPVVFRQFLRVLFFLRGYGNIQNRHHL